jgi:hypothetical protein
MIQNGFELKTTEELPSGLVREHRKNGCAQAAWIKK